MKKKDNKNKLLKKVVIGCFIVMILELIAMFVVRIFRERNIDHIDAVNDLIKVEDGYIAVGVSDFSDSKSVVTTVQNTTMLHTSAKLIFEISDTYFIVSLENVAQYTPKNLKPRGRPKREPTRSIITFSNDANARISL